MGTPGLKSQGPRGWNPCGWNPFVDWHVVSRADLYSINHASVRLESVRLARIRAVSRADLYWINHASAIAIVRKNQAEITIYLFVEN